MVSVNNALYVAWAKHGGLSNIMKRDIIAVKVMYLLESGTLFWYTLALQRLFAFTSRLEP